MKGFAQFSNLINYFVFILERDSMYNYLTRYSDIHYKSLT